ncbi:ankyrin repeat domain-containing protein SOWAHD [Sorex araneus]|uniref:ankyrin repeat domain-containing protein SOWAHD n=1 Tax=Sorex araneus TaxID=42254 RepID=UPI0024335372|nr:ankyrin repeat domain-containing protein SOWAHD [Sorex araneus]
MAEPPGDANPAPKSSMTATVSLRRASQPRPLRVDSASLARYRSSVSAASSSRESSFLGALTPSATGSGRRRGAAREQLGLQEGRAEEPYPGAAGAAGGGGLCLEPREHAWLLAAAGGRYEELQEVLESEPGLLLWADPISGYTLLHWLAKHGRHEELILVHDFARRHGLSLDVSAPGSGGLTPLHLAAMQGHDMAIKVLVGALGADPTRRDHSGHRACHYLRPGVSPSLRELAGAEEWEMEKPASKRSNANNNSSGVWALRRSSSALGPSTTHTTGKRTTKTASKKDSSAGGRVAHIQTFIRHVFPFFQDR